MNKKAGSKLPLNPKAPFKWVFMDVIPSTAPKSLTSDTNFKNIRKEKEKARSAGTSSLKKSDRPTRKCFRCGAEDHLIAKYPKPPKDSEKRRKSDKSKDKVNRACDNSNDDNDLKVYASMARMSNYDVGENKDYGDSSQLTNWILD